MPKLKRLTTQMGNLLDPVYKHMKKVELVVSPFDGRGNKIAKFYHPLFSNVPEKLRPEEFSYQFKEDHNSKNTYLKIQYVNEWEYKYVLSNHNLPSF